MYLFIGSASAADPLEGGSWCPRWSWTVAGVAGWGREGSRMGSRCKDRFSMFTYFSVWLFAPGGSLGGPWGSPGGSLGISWGGLGGPWGTRGVLGGALGGRSGFLGGPWGVPGGLWGLPGGPWGIPGGPWEIPGHLLGNPRGSQGTPQACTRDFLESLKNHRFSLCF